MQISLNLPADYEIPTILADNEPVQNAAILSMGCAAYISGHDAIEAGIQAAQNASVTARLTAQQNKHAAREAELMAILTTLKDELQRANEMYQNAQCLRDQALREQEQRLNEQREQDVSRRDAEWRARYEQQSAHYSEELRKEKQELTETLARLRKQMSEQQVALDTAQAIMWKAVQDAREEERVRCNQLEARLESQTEASRVERAAFNKSIDGLRTVIQTATTTRIAREANSSRKGAAAEQMLLELVHLAVAEFPDGCAQVMQTTTQAESGDIHVIFNDIVPPFRIMVDSKDYSRNVNPEERAKLRRDMDAWTDVRAGILVSLQSGIVDATNGEIEYTVANKPLLNLCHLKKQVPEVQIQTLVMAFSVLRNFARWNASREALAVAHAKVKENQRTMDLLHNQIAAADKNALATLRSINDMRNTVTQLQIELVDSLAVAVPSTNDVIADWWNTRYERCDGQAVELMDAFAEWKNSAVSDRPVITKDWFIALVSAVVGADAVDVSLRTGPGGTKRIMENTKVVGWRVKPTVADSADDCEMQIDTGIRVRVVIEDTHEDIVDRRKTFTKITAMLRAKGAVGASYWWRANETESAWQHVLCFDGVSNSAHLVTDGIRKWCDNITVEEVNDMEWENEMDAWKEWSATGQIAVAGARVSWSRISV